MERCFNTKVFYRKGITNPYVSFDSKIEPNIQAELVEKAVAEAERSTKENNVTAEFKDHFSKLDPDGVLAFMQCTKGTTINVDGCVGTALQDVVDIYPATWNGVSTKKFFVENGITNPYVSFDSKIEPSTQSEVQEEAYNSATASTAEVISQLLESEVTLTNGKKIEVKKFIELLDKGNTGELEYNFKKLKSTDSASIAKEMALKLAHDLLHSKKDFDVVDSTAQNMGKVIPDFVTIYENYGALTDKQLHIEEMEISNVSHLFDCDYTV